MLRSVMLPLALLSAPALASASHYHAQPIEQPADARLIARDTIWKCGASGCTSPRSGSRPAIVCASLVRKVGALRSFSADGPRFDAQELENCNRRAR